MQMVIIYLLLLIAVGYYFLRRHGMQVVPTLMYHRIATVAGDRNSLPPTEFAWQMQYLAEHDYTALTVAQLYEHYAHGTPLPPKSVLISFDDGYVDNYTVALPILQQYGFSAVVFPIAGWVGKANTWENFGKAPTTLMDWQQLAQWQKSGMEVAIHTVTHPFLPNCSREKIEAELLEARQLLSEHLQGEFSFFCYPYGKLDQKAIDLLKSTRYKAAFAIFEDVSLSRVDLWRLPRIPIPAHQKRWEFKLKVSWLFYVFVALRKWERQIKRYFRR